MNPNNLQRPRGLSLSAEFTFDLGLNPPTALHASSSSSNKGLEPTTLRSAPSILRPSPAPLAAPL